MPLPSPDAIIGLVHRLKPPVSPKAAAALPQTVALNTLSLQALEPFLETASFPAALSNWLSEGEKRLFAGFTSRKRRLEWLGGRLSVKVSILSLLSDGNPSLEAGQLEILPDLTGRPHLASLGAVLPERLFFSISHSGGHAAALASLIGPCGLDIQQLSPSLPGIRERFSSARERKLLQSCRQFAELDKIAQLALLWSAKEAFRKALQLNPLPGFLEIRLTARPQLTGRAFELSADFNRKGQHLDFSVTAWLQEDMAMAVTFI